MVVGDQNRIGTDALAGLRVVNTRPIEQAAELDALLRGAGAIPLSYPCVAIAEASKISLFDDALRSDSFDWIYLTSQNALDMLIKRANAMELERSRLTIPRYAAVGTETALALKRALDIEADFVVGTFESEATARDCPAQAGERILMPVSDQASEEPAQQLADKGANVTRIVVYRTVIGRGGVDVGTLLSDGKVDAITFTNPSAVAGFVKRLKQEEGNLDHARQVPIACIGPNTRNRAISENMLRAFCPDEHTLQGMLAALSDFMQARQQRGRPWG